MSFNKSCNFELFIRLNFLQMFNEVFQKNNYYLSNFGFKNIERNLIFIKITMIQNQKCIYLKSWSLVIGEHNINYELIP